MANTTQAAVLSPTLALGHAKDHKGPYMALNYLHSPHPAQEVTLS